MHSIAVAIIRSFRLFWCNRGSSAYREDRQHIERTRKANEGSLRVEWTVYWDIKLGAWMIGHTAVNVNATKGKTTTYRGD
jgi:hypothetical protein